MSEMSELQQTGGVDNRWGSSAALLPDQPTPLSTGTAQSPLPLPNNTLTHRREEMKSVLFSAERISERSTKGLLGSEPGSPAVGSGGCRGYR